MSNKEMELRQARRVLNKRISVYKEKITPTANDQQISTFVFYKNIYAQVKNLYGKEFFEAKRINAEKTVKFICRYGEAHELDESMRLHMDGKQFNIVFIDNINYLNELIEIKAMEVSK